MNKPPQFIWLAIILLLLLPSAGARFLLNIAGGVIFFILLTPILIAGIGWIGWKILQSKLTKCESCGTTFFNEVSKCPLCGSTISNNNGIAASSVIIDITPKELKEK
tara:strand:- start:1359 stop:1679 length:321 start_codon:yes stop_codon:yes gene_type:complete